MRLEGEKLGHYQLTRFIQSGGMGEVYLAKDLTLSREVAIKVMKTEPVRYPDAQSSKDAARLFQREMQAISMLDHAHILTLHEAGEQQIGHDNITYMVMPYCPEGSLSDWIHHYHSTQPLSPNKVAQILQQAADALQYAHDQKILHLDVKPSNFLVRRQQDPSQLPNLLLADFGVAKIATTSKLSGTVRGTLEYMAPEQVEGAPVAASDQYALGIMVYELLTGRTPYQGALPHVVPYMRNKVDPEPPSSVNRSLPSSLDRIVLQALAKVPQDRFASVKEFASAFAAVLKPNADPSPKPEPVDSKLLQPIPPNRQLSPKAYELARAHQLGTPLEEFRIDYMAAASVAGTASVAGVLLVATGHLGILGVGTGIAILLAGLARSAQKAEVGGVLEKLLGCVLLSSIAVSAGAVAGTVMGEITGTAVLNYSVVGAVVGAVVLLICLLRLLRSWRVYLCSDGFIYTDGKNIDVFPWHQIKLAEKHQSTYNVIRRDSKKAVLDPRFQSIEYLGDYIIREYERVNKP